MAGVLLRLVFAAIFGTTGFLLGREAYDRAISIHVANQWWQFAAVVIAPVIGALLGVLVVPMAQRVFERELPAVERAIDRMAPGELIGGAIGLTGGLIIAFLAKSVLFEFITFAGRTGSYIAIVIYIVVSIFAAHLGARVGAKQRVGIGRFANVAVAAGGAPKVSSDTSVIIDGRILDIVGSGLPRRACCCCRGSSCASCRTSPIRAMRCAARARSPRTSSTC